MSKEKSETYYIVETDILKDFEIGSIFSKSEKDYELKKILDYDSRRILNELFLEIDEELLFIALNLNDNIEAKKSLINLCKRFKDLKSDSQQYTYSLYDK